MNFEQSGILIFEKADLGQSSSKLTYIIQKNLDLFFCQYPVIMYVSKTLQTEAEKCSSLRCASAGATGSTFAKNTSSKQQHYFVYAVITKSLLTIFFFWLWRLHIFNDACFNNILF
jgi:hypothetical protein